MSRISLRLRSVAAAAAAILLALGAAGVAVDVLVSRHLHHSLDATLRRRAISVAQLAAAAPAVLTTPGSLESPLGGTQLSVEVVDMNAGGLPRPFAVSGRKNAPRTPSLRARPATCEPLCAAGPDQIRIAWSASRIAASSSS